MIRCNNCMKLFDSDDDLEYMIDKNGECFWGCPDCRTDKYLMDLD